jgi:hypothetical protein
MQFEAAEQALAAHSRLVGFFGKLRGRAAEAQALDSHAMFVAVG